MTSKIRFIMPVTAIVICLFLSHAKANQGDDLDLAWSKLRDGKAIAIMRHALAPGFSDPAGFDIDNCATQRNLSEQGRDQAQRIGELFRDQQLDDIRLYSSQWCRCVDTASLLGIGEVNELPSLNTFFENREKTQEQTALLLEDINALLASGTKPVVLVSHQVNINALTNAATASGDTLIISVVGNDVTVLARVVP